MTLTSTYDHRIIQGAESGRFLARIDALLGGADAFYEGVFAALGVTLTPLPPRAIPQPPTAAPLKAVPSEELLQAAATANALVRSLRTHGHLAAHLDPLGSTPRGDPALDPQAIGLTTVLMAQIPSKLLHIFVPGATLAESFPRLRDTYCGTIAYQIEHIASHQVRRWLREKIESGAFRKPLGRGRAARAADPPDRGRLARALHAQGLSRPAPVLDRGHRHDRADARRADPPVGGRRRRGGRRRHGPPRPPERARPQPRPPLRDDLRRVRGRLDARGGDDDPAGRHRRRQVPPRRPGSLPARVGRVDPRQPGVQPVASGVRLAGRDGSHARRPERARRAPTRSATRRGPCRS